MNMELEQEVLHLREQCRSFGLIVSDLKTHLLALYAPTQTPRPRPELLLGLRLLATLDGLPAQCSDHACRRKGLCQATDVSEPICTDFWTDARFERLGLIATGIELSAAGAESRDAAIHAQLLRSFATSQPKPATGSRKKRSA